jgi:uncharacterized membrane protein
MRLYHLDAATLSHPEVWLPGIPLPAWVTMPRQRLDARDIVLMADIHPPGYHLAMLGWERFFGISVESLRLPSAIFGFLVAPAAFLYARRAAGFGVAVLATIVLAWHGNLIFWSQQARHWTIMAFVALMSSWLLMRLVQRWNALEAVGYCACVAFGLWAEFTFWPLLAAQMIWLTLRHARREAAPTALAASMLALVLGTPVLFNLTRATQLNDILERATVTRLLEQLQFGLLFDLTHGLTWHAPMLTALGLVLAALGAAALVAGLRAQAAAPDDPAAAPESSSRIGWLVVGAVLADLFVYAFFVREYGLRKSLLAVMIAPWLVIAGWLVLRRIWKPLWSSLPRTVVERAAALAGAEPTAMLAIAPLVMLLVIELADKPVLARRNLLMYMPFALILMIRGIERIRAVVPRRVAIAALLAVTVAGALEGLTRPLVVRDYKGLFGQLAPRTRPGDLFVLADTWYNTPFHYYLRAPAYHVVPPDSVPQAPPRAWVIVIGSEERMQQDLASIASAHLQGSTAVEQVRAYNTGAALYVPAAATGAAPRP